MYANTIRSLSPCQIWLGQVRIRTLIWARSRRAAHAAFICVGLSATSSRLTEDGCGLQAAAGGSDSLSDILLKTALSWNLVSRHYVKLLRNLINRTGVHWRKFCVRFRWTNTTIRSCAGVTGRWSGWMLCVYNVLQSCGQDSATKGVVVEAAVSVVVMLSNFLPTQKSPPSSLRYHSYTTPSFFFVFWGRSLPFKWFTCHVL